MPYGPLFTVQLVAFGSQSGEKNGEVENSLAKINLQYFGCDAFSWFASSWASST